jgi:hypothetical protein
MAVMRLSPMNVIQQERFAALKIHETERVADSLREVGVGRERRDSNFLQIAPVIALTAVVLDEAVGGRSFDAGCDTHVSNRLRRTHE